MNITLSTLSAKERELIINALWAVTETGGTSPTWSLLAKLRGEWGAIENFDRVLRMQEIAKRELEL